MSRQPPFSAPDSDVPRRVDLSRIRHELRTPINHILGYTEMLLEEGELPASFTEDLRRIHAGGRQLQQLIAEYFDEQKFFTHRDLHQLYHELRTPVNHIIGYSELLQEQAADQGLQAPIADLQKIHSAAGDWLALVEAYLIESPANSGASAGGEGKSEPRPITVNPGLGFQVPEPKTAASAFADEGAILIVDDDEHNRDMLSRRLRRCGYTVSSAAHGLHALQLARSRHFDLVLLDMIMPGLDGFQILARMKNDAVLREVPVIMLSALDEENGIARCIEMGAEDYLSKPFNPVFLRARIGACLEKKRLRDRERSAYAALEKSQKHLADELTKAAEYVRSILPAPLTGLIETEWSFQPSEQLGGDGFGYHWIDDSHFAVYLLDVCGHGVGAALLSVSVLNALRIQALAGVDFRNPADVLSALNRTFPMEKQNQSYFTAWYGVYHRDRRDLLYASGGHPPALMLPQNESGAPTLTELTTSAPAIGCFDQAQFRNAAHPVERGGRLLVLSDGVYEIFRGDDRVGTWEEFVASFNSPEIAGLRPAERLLRAQELRGAETLEDDFSLVEVRFA